MDAFKVILPRRQTFAQYRNALAALAGEGLDVGIEQVGVHEGIVRAHVVEFLLQSHPGKTVADLLVTSAGASRVEPISDADADVLFRHRIAEDLEPRQLLAVPEQAGGRGWHLEAVKVQTAWDQLGGPDAIDWGGIRVGQIDTGYTRHAAFGFPAASWVAAADCRTFEPFPASLDGIDPLPFGAVSKGHGTRIGATISGRFDFPDGTSYRGIAPRVPHVVVRITDSVAINTRQAEFIQALDYLVDEARVSVVNISLGLFPPVASKAVRDAMERAHNKGVIVLCAAGNGVDQVVMPAALETAIAVGGSTWQSLPWHGSSFGPEVDFSAPAAGIFRADPLVKGGKGFADGGDGTSYATAISSGAAALWLRRWGSQIDAMYGPGSARVKAFRLAAMATARVPAGWQPTPFGSGILDIGALCTNAALALPTMSLAPVPAAIAAAAPALQPGVTPD